MSKEQQNPDAEQQQQDIAARNLRFYNQACEVPMDAQKEIKAGRIKGMTDVNPMWRMKKMTEMFGPCGIGWKYVIDRQWTEQYGQVVKCFCNVLLYFRDPETKEWSEAIPGNGGSSIVSVEGSGQYVNDEGYKMALTDALSIAMKALGVGGNIWYGPKATGHNESKYETAAAQQTQPQAQQVQQRSTASVAYTGSQLQEALADLGKARTQKEYEAVWTKWSQQSPALCKDGTPFFKACVSKAAELNS